MKTLVTGGTGYIGSHLINSLLNDNLETHIITRSKSNINIFNSNHPCLHIHKHDGTTSNMVKIFKISKPDIVFHLASMVIFDHKSIDIEPLIKSNLLLGAQILEAMHINKIDKLINTGTFWQNYENQDYNPVCLYAATKQAFEDIIRYYVEINSLKVIDLKLFDTYGPNDKRIKLFTILKTAIKTNKILNMTKGDQLVDLVFIDDIINAFRISANRLFNESNEKYEKFVVSSGNPIPLKKIVSEYFKVVGKEIKVNWGGKKYKDREVMIPWNKGNPVPNWKPEITLTKGIKLITNSFDDLIEN